MFPEIAKQLIKTALDHGARGAIYLPGERIVVDAQFRDICRSNSCGRFGRCYMCPPDVGDIEKLMETVRKYPHAVVYQTVSSIEDPFDFEGMMEAGDAHSRTSSFLQEAAAAMEGDTLHLSSGCRLCKVCAKVTGDPCRHPGKALAAVEGYGIDVYRTVQDTPLKYTNGANTVTYFGIILFSE